MYEPIFLISHNSLFIYCFVIWSLTFPSLLFPGLMYIKIWQISSDIVVNGVTNSELHSVRVLLPAWRLLGTLAIGWLMYNGFNLETQESNWLLNFQKWCRYRDCLACNEEKILTLITNICKLVIQYWDLLGQDYTLAFSMNIVKIAITLHSPSPSLNED